MASTPHPESAGQLHGAWSWRRALLKSDLPSTTRHVLLTLSCHVPEAGSSSFPSLKTLAEETGLTRKSVKRHLRSVEGSWVRRSKRLTETGRQTSNLYELMAPPEGGGGGNEVPSPPRDSPPEGGTRFPPHMKSSYEKLNSSPRKEEQETLPFGERELPLFGGSSSYRPEERAPARSFAKKAWELWLEELGGEAPLPKLTEKRKEKLERLWAERMHEHGFPQAYVVWRAMLEELQASDHHMSRRSYQMPESFLKNEERRERWYLDGLERAKKPGREESADHSAMDLQGFRWEDEDEDG